VFVRRNLAVSLALALPMAALADLNGSATLPSGTALSLDTGVTSSSGGDILFNGSTGQIAPQGSATALMTISVTVAQFDATTLAQIESSSFEFSDNPVEVIDWPAYFMFYVHTNGGNWAKVLVMGVDTSSIVLMYDTFGVAASSNTPTITAVQDAGSYTPNIAEGSVFVVKGTGLSAAGLTQPPFPLPTAIGGVTITFTPASGGTGTPAYIDYLYNEGGVNQLAAVLPSTVATGKYNVTVTTNGAASSPFPVTVVAQKPGLLTADESGDGLVVAQNYISATELDLDRYTTGTVAGYTISPAYPGETLTAWATGLGPVAGGDNIASAGYNFEANGVNVQVIVGGISITPTYAGRAPGLAGADQIDFTLPANVTTGCVVPFQVSVNGVMSQVTVLSIAAPGASVCAQPGYTTSQLQNFDQGGAYLDGRFSILGITESGLGQTFTTNSVGGSFIQVSGFELERIPPNSHPTQGCTVTQIGPATSTSIPGTSTILDACKLTISGPPGSGLSNMQIPEASNVYALGIGGVGSTVNFVAGTYTLNGAGGTAVGPFTATLTLPTPLTVTGGLPSTVNRSNDLTINWTGDNSADEAIVFGSAATLVNGSPVSGATFTCITTAGAGGFTVPSSILNQLPAITAAQIADNTAEGSIEVAWAVSGNGLFTAPLVAGGSISGAFVGGEDNVGTAEYQ
jgi:uncharacterized protein (TIGR03437 family)